MTSHFIAIFTLLCTVGCCFALRLDQANDDTSYDFLTSLDFDIAKSIDWNQNAFDFRGTAAVRRQPFSITDLILGRRRKKISTFPTIDPTLIGGKYEGDIAGFFRGLFRIQTWPNAIVPYVISKRYDVEERALIAKVFSDLQQVTCIRFVPRSDEHRNYIFILPDGAECYSSAGMMGGMQKLSVGTGCFQYGTIMHELSHALGRWHEQSRPDRDEFIKILWYNIMPHAKDQFVKHPKHASDENEIKLPYDYSSIMHYSPYAFSHNGYPTIEALKRGGEKMGQRDALSPLDMQKLNHMYKCPQEDGGDERPDHVVTKRPASETTTRNGLCADKSNMCPIWRALGWCQKITRFMTNYCSGTCQFCQGEINSITSKLGRNSTRTTLIPSIFSTSTVSPNIESDACKDKLPFSCKLWAQSGDCHTKQRFMARYCQETCKICRKVTKIKTITGNRRVGSDNDATQSTDSTTTTLISTTPTVAVCRDNKDYCSRWAKSGYCDKAGYNRYVKSECPVSCGLCKPLL